MKTNYNEKMKAIIEELNGERKTLLLHSCCAPCSSSVIERLSRFFDITIFYYNPNILPKEEYEKRKAEQKRLIEILNKENENQIKIFDCDNNSEDFFCAIKGKESLDEGSLRCKECYRFRIKKTSQMAKENKFDFYSTTLSVSPHKNVEWINEIMEEIYEIDKSVRPLFSDFKKENGYLRSIVLAKQFDLYRQNYCGCRPIKV